MDRDQPIVLTGFMGTGKTEVGRSLAEFLGRPFVDMDEEIERRTGKTIAEIFSKEGESAFRDLERAVCMDLSGRSGKVIATGGGALLNVGCREAMVASSLVVCLTCEVAELERRLSSDGHRPLLAWDGPLRERIEQVLADRRESYEALPWHVDTTGKSVGDVVSAIAGLARMQRIPVRHDVGSYDILLGQGMLDFVGDALRPIGILAGSDVVLLTNRVVEPLYADRTEAALAGAGLRVHRIVVPDGEGHKSLETIRTIYEEMLQRGIDRRGVILSLGGGVTGDMAGFVAATYLRGIRFVQMPTTLLAMVDASIGGKTGVDLPEGKNLVGAFKQPELVLIDPDVLGTLPDEELRSGLAEMLKHGVLGDRTLFELTAQSTPAWSDLPDDQVVDRIARALAVKIGVVEHDPHESDRRMILNLGHTIGHGLEKLSGFSIRHGEAVAIGMVGAAKLSVRLGLVEPGLTSIIEGVLRDVGLPTACPAFGADEILASLGSDKKRAGGRLRWVLPRDVGDVVIRDDVPEEVVREVLIEMGARS